MSDVNRVRDTSNKSEAWQQGYHDGLSGAACNDIQFEEQSEQEDYRDGHAAGTTDRS